MDETLISVTYAALWNGSLQVIHVSMDTTCRPSSYSDYKPGIARCRCLPMLPETTILGTQTNDNTDQPRYTE